MSYQFTPEQEAEATAVQVAVEQKYGIVRPKPAIGFIPHKPTPRQQLFLELRNEKEVFYGGAAGGGKSDALLMAGLEYVDVKGYSALLVRRTYADLAKQGALMDRTKEWLTGSGASWNEQKKLWTFPSGAKLSFGYMETENDKYQYQGAEFQYIGVDELSQLTRTQYLYLFSRLRRLADVNIPIRMRAGSNPGGVGGSWVKERFIPDEFTPEQATEERVWQKDAVDEETGEEIKRFFVPARLDDNPHLDQKEYDLSLRELDPVERAQLRRGDWHITVRGDILFMWDERYHVITWQQFAKVFGADHIPLHWKLGVFQDWGTTEEHPCVTKWFATAGENAPVVGGVPLAGSVFCYRSMLLTQCTATEVKRKIYDAMVPHKEIPRTHHWEMSHEASSERLEYNRSTDTAPFILSFKNWDTGRTRGIEQLKNALTLRDTDKPNPFIPQLFGHPRLYFIVDDAELINPKTEAGMLRIRAEAPAYKWDKPKSGEAPARLVPYALFNDAIDVTKAAAAKYFPSIAELTDDERFAQYVEQQKPFLKPEAIAAETDDDRKSQRIADLLQEKKAFAVRESDKGREHNDFNDYVVATEQSYEFFEVGDE